MLRKIQELYEVNDIPAEQFWSAADQAVRVMARLKQLNPKMSAVKPILESRGVTGLELPAQNVKDLSPLPGLTALRHLKCAGTAGAPGEIRDLTPLKGLRLEMLDLSQNADLADLRPLAGMPLKRLGLFATSVSDLTPLKGSKLEVLQLAGTRVTDLKPLKGLPLKMLVVNDTAVSDLTPLEGMPLEGLECGNTKVSDLGPLRRLRLRYLNVVGCRQLRDLTPLKDMPLEDLIASDDLLVANRKLLQARPALRTINRAPAAQFWKRQDARAPSGKP
jgi:Leucine-rich repeat (LRR) protein